MKQRWRFYGREAEMAQLRAACLAPEFDLVALRGDRCMGKTWLLREVADDMPANRPLFCHQLLPCRDRQEAAHCLLADLREPRRDGWTGETAGKAAREAGALPRDVTAILEHLLRSGVSVALDEAHWLWDGEAPGLAGLAQEIGDLALKLRRETRTPGSGWGALALSA